MKQLRKPDVGNMKTVMAVVAVGLSVASFAESATLVVDKTGAGGAYVSIQSAVDAANDGDTILVKPGVYDNGFKTYTYTDDASVTHTFTNRIMLTKKLHLKAEGRADETVILGAWDGGTSTGIGPAAVRCVYVDSDGCGSVIEGFTIRDGNCHVRYKADGKTNIDDVLPNRGGGITASSNANTAFFAVGCVFDHCSGFRGGALRFGSAIRCRFVNLQGSGACVGRETAFMNCLIEGNRTNGGMFMGATLVNCTVVGNGGSGFAFSSPVYLYNSVCVGNNGYGASLGTAAASSTLSRSVVYDIQTTETPKKDFFKTVDNAVTGNDLVLFAPLFGDYRVLSGSDAEGLGDAAVIGQQLDVSDAAAPIDLYRDFSGAAIPKTGVINPGCIQATAVAAGGCARFMGKVAAKGYAVKQDNVSLWAYSEKPIDIFKVTVASQPFYWNAPAMRMPELDGGVYVGIPGAGVVTTNEAVMPVATLMVDKDDPTKYATIQAALDAIKDSSPRVILVAAGVYDDVGFESSDRGNSCIRLIRPVRIVGAGRGKSTIRGKKAETDDGRGPGASRCVHFDNRSVIQIVQGFTLTGGRCVGTEIGDTDANSGGLVLGGDMAYQYLLDCELSDGYAYRGAAAKRVTLERCHIHDVKASSAAIVRPGRMRSSLVEASEGASGDVVVDLQNAPVATSTFVSSSPSFTPGGQSQSLHMGNYNSIYYSIAESPLSPRLALGANTAGIVCYGRLTTDIQTDTTPGYVNVAPLFVNATKGDYRLASCSPAITNGFADVENYWEDPCLSDLNGNPRLFVDGKPVPGAVQTVVEALDITADQGAEVSPSGLIALEPGESVTVMATSKDAQRTVVGFVVDGEKVPGGSWTYRAPVDGSWTRGGHAVTALLTSDWYVKPNGSNAANGWTPETAFATLTYAMSVSRAGDTVHALEGVYTEDSEVGGGIDCRVVIKDGVSLVGDAGAEKTVIMGGAGVRPAAFAGKSGSLRGVTLTGGVLAKDSDEDAKRGGGVWADNRTVTVCDCVISNNVCARGGAAYCCKLVNCRIIGNEGAQTSGAAYYSTLYGCYMDKNICGSGQLLRFLYGLYNCTLGPDNSKASVVIGNNSGVIENCAILCGTASDVIADARNCVVLESQKARYGDDNIIPIADVTAAKLDSAGRPSKDSPLVDAGRALSEGMPASDFFGTQWYYNDAPDIGAYEYDWRGVYQSDLGTCATVVAADPRVVETEGKVLVKDGAITVRFTDEMLKAKYKIPFRVTGTGTLTLKARDKVIGTYTLADGAQTLTYKNRIYGNDLAFSYAPGENDKGGALLDAQSGDVSGFLLNVR